MCVTNERMDKSDQPHLPSLSGDVPRLVLAHVVHRLIDKLQLMLLNPLYVLF